jgi:hypothetical protein
MPGVSLSKPPASRYSPLTRCHATTSNILGITSQFTSANRNVVKDAYFFHHVFIFREKEKKNDLQEHMTAFSFHILGRTP